MIKIKSYAYINLNLQQRSVSSSALINLHQSLNILQNHSYKVGLKIEVSPVSRLGDANIQSE